MINTILYKASNSDWDKLLYSLRYSETKHLIYFIEYMKLDIDKLLKKLDISINIIKKSKSHKLNMFIIKHIKKEMNNKENF
jgi:hypothetical protein